jgi:hypothetical protein
MNWPTELSSSQPIAWAVLALTQIKIKGVGIGGAGVLFQSSPLPNRSIKYASNKNANYQKTLNYWCIRQDLNLQPSDPKSEALSN